ncbi:hypothetical protein HPP92_005517 [Vanilla planifolia]|uniref:Uncharacterized protein n=1 Tax=Vanilla planifolia TaxID=51239 RepID=A0A835RN11_VANPL|nr:hypothetical protein HPP92_005517 [Vanilla planifolia]
MGVVSVSSSASRTTTLAVGGGFSAGRSQALRRSSISFVAFKSPDRDVVKTLPKYGKQSKRAEIVTVDATAAVPSAAKEDLDYNEVAEVLENIYKLSPAQISEVEQEEQRGRRGKRRKRGERGELDGVVRNRKMKMRRLSLDLRIELRRRRWREGVADAGEDVWWKGETGREKEAAEVFKLLREYSMSTDAVSLDWKKMKIPRVLSLYEHKWLFKLMQPMKGTAGW